MNITRKEYDEAKRLLDEIQGELRRGDLTPQQRTEMEHHAARLAGALCSPWFPMSRGRRLLVIAIVGLGVQQAYIGNYQPMLWWILLLFFSPRIVGEAAYYFGVFRGLISKAFSR